MPTSIFIEDQSLTSFSEASIALITKSQSSTPTYSLYIPQTNLDALPSAKVMAYRQSPDALRSGPCRTCPTCPQGVFKTVGAHCDICHHNLACHINTDPAYRFGVLSDIVCDRVLLIRGMVQLLRDKKIIAIRATPATGKTSLLKLMAQSILYQDLDLEPVYIKWPSNPHSKEYYEILDHEEESSKRKNEEERDEVGGDKPRAPPKKVVYLIDDAKNTYSDHSMWDDLFKGNPSDAGAFFVLAFAYGFPSGYRNYGNIPAMSSYIPPERRVELRPTHDQPLGMMLSTEETHQMVDRWLESHEQGARCGDEFYEYIEVETGGHAGMLN